MLWPLFVFEGNFWFKSFYYFAFGEECLPADARFFFKSKSVHDPGHNFKVNISQDGVHMSKNQCDIEGMLEDSWNT